MALELELEDDSLDKSEYLGMIFMDVTLVPKYDLNEGDNATVRSHTHIVIRPKVHT